jgi:hypothetical protein
MPTQLEFDVHECRDTLVPLLPGDQHFTVIELAKRFHSYSDREYLLWNDAEAFLLSLRETFDQKIIDTWIEAHLGGCVRFVTDQP